MKAILVGDMPESCEECSVFYRTPGDFGCGVSSHHLMDWTVRPGWCPFHPLPEKRNTSLIELRHEAEENGVTVQYQAGFNFGWNACLEAITGGEEE